MRSLLSLITGSRPDRHAADPMIHAGRLAAEMHPGRNALGLMAVTHFAQVVHIGRTGTPLFPDRLLASAMGPTNGRLAEDLRRHVRGRDAGRPPSRDRAAPLDPEAIRSIEDACAYLRDATAVELLAFYSRPGGSFSTCWRPDPFGERPIGDPTRWQLPRRRCDDGATITVQAMADEYRATFGGAAMAA